MHSAILKFVPAKATFAVGRLGLHLSKQSPHILFGAGVIGFGATVYLASKATLELNERVDDMKENVDGVRQLRESALSEPEGDKFYSHMDYRKDLLYVYTGNLLSITKLYAPTVLVGFASVACLTKSHTILTNRNTALMAAYSALDKSYSAYRKRVIEELGEDKDREFRFPSEKYKVLSNAENGKTKEVVKSRAVNNGEKSSYARFFDELCQNWKRNPEYNFYFLRAQQNWANDLLRARGHVFLNEIYDMLDIPRTKAGAVVGWVLGDDGDNYIDFGIFDGDNPAARDFVNGREGSILLDFNVDGVILDKIGR